MIKDKDGKTPVDLAMQHYNYQIAYLINATDENKY